jgi:hypothetical protein
MTLRSYFFSLGLLTFWALPATAQEDVEFATRHIQLDANLVFPRNPESQAFFQSHSLVQAGLSVGLGSKNDQAQLVFGLGYMGFRMDSVRLSRLQVEVGGFAPVKLSEQFSLRLRSVLTYNAFNDRVNRIRNGDGFGVGFQTTLGLQCMLGNSLSYLFSDAGYDYSVNNGDRGYVPVVRDWSGFRIRTGLVFFLNDD